MTSKKLTFSSSIWSIYYSIKYTDWNILFSFQKLLLMLTWVSSIFLLGPSERRETIEITISKQLFGIRETRFQVILTKFWHSDGWIVGPLHRFLKVRLISTMPEKLSLKQQPQFSSMNKETKCQVDRNYSIDSFMFKKTPRWMDGGRRYIFNNGRLRRTLMCRNRDEFIADTTYLYGVFDIHLWNL